MARFQFCLMGGGPAPIIEMAQRDLQALSEDMVRARFVSGEMMNPDTGELGPKVLVAVSRVQMVLELNE